MDFPYHRAVAPMMWVFMAIATVELLVVHLLLLLLVGPWAAVAASVVALAGMAWLVVLIASFRRLLESDRLVMRIGTLRRVDLPLAMVAGLRRQWDARSLKAGGVLKLSLIAYPNIVVDLVEPLPGRRRVTAVAHRLDDPAAFVAALRARGVFQA